MKSEDSPSNPMVILELTWPGEEQTEVPLFAAVNLTEALLKKLQMHSFLCRQYSLDDVVARFPDDEVFWDIRQDSALSELADVQTVWHSTGFDHEVRLRGRRPQPGGAYGPLLDIAVSVAPEISEFQKWRNAGYIIDFCTFELEDEDAGDESFMMRVYLRMVEMRLWPAGKPPP